LSEWLYNAVADKQTVMTPCRTHFDFLACQLKYFK